MSRSYRSVGCSRRAPLSFCGLGGVVVTFFDIVDEWPKCMFVVVVFPRPFQTSGAHPAGYFAETRV